MKSKSMNIRQMLHDIQVKRSKLDFQERKLKERLAQLEGVTPREIIAHSNADSAVRDSEHTATQGSSCITRSYVFGENSAKTDPIDTPQYQLDDVLKKEIKDGHIKTYKDVVTFLTTAAREPRLKGGNLLVNLTGIGFKPDVVSAVKAELGQIKLPTLLIIS